MTHILCLLLLHGKRWKLKTLCSWRTCSSPLHWPVKQSIHVSHCCSFSTVRNQLRVGAQTVWKSLSDLQKCYNSYLNSLFQSVAFTLQCIGFDVMCIADFFFFFFSRLFAHNVSPHLQCVEKLQMCRYRADWVFFFRELSIEQTKTCNPQKIVCCAEKQSGKQQETRLVCKSLPNGLNPADLRPYVNFLLSSAGPRCSSPAPDNNFQASFVKRRLLSGARGTERTVVPIYQLRENLHFNWILMFEPNYTC